MKKHSIFQGIALTRKLAAILVLLAVAATSFYIYTPDTKASSYSIVILSHYNKILKVGQSFYLTGVSSTGKRIRHNHGRRGKLQY